MGRISKSPLRLLLVDLKTLGLKTRLDVLLLHHLPNSFHSNLVHIEIYLFRQSGELLLSSFLSPRIIARARATQRERERNKTKTGRAVTFLFRFPLADFFFSSSSPRPFFFFGTGPLGSTMSWKRTIPAKC